MSVSLLTAKQVAAILGITDRSVRTLVQLGRLAKVDVLDRAVRFHPDDVAAFIESRRSKPRTGRSKSPSAPPAVAAAPPPKDGTAS
jgi:excisionase family DNA binding protein